MKIVIDTNVAISGLFWSGPPNIILKWTSQSIIRIIVSEKIINEFRRVICHDRFAHRLKVLQKSAEEATAYFINLAQFVPDPDNIPNIICEDPFDNIFLALAKENDARLVVSGDKHLLNVREFKGIHIIKPSEACQLIKELTH